MKIDIIVPTYHRYELLAETLESVRSQTYPHWECWIAEDGESDRTSATVAPFLDDKRFHYLPGEHIGTPAAPRNRGIKAGQAPYIAFLDDDDIWLPNKLDVQIAFLKDNPQCVLLGSNALIMKEDQDYRKDTLPLYFEKAPVGLVPYKKLVQDDYFINSTAVIRRSALKYAGLQNEKLHKGPDGEDHDLWLRIGPLGEMWLMSDPLIVYRDVVSKKTELPKTRMERRRETYRTRFKIYRSALNGVGEMPSPLSFPEYERQERLCRCECNFYDAGPRFLGRLLHNIGSTLADFFYLPASERDLCSSAIQTYLKCKDRWDKVEKPSTSECIIFSKDRALQLHALLSTLREKISPKIPIHVLYLTSSVLHQKEYEDLIGIFEEQKIRFTRQSNENSFKQDLMEILFTLTCDMLFFLTDEIPLAEPIDIRDLYKFDPDIFVPSLQIVQNVDSGPALDLSQALSDIKVNRVGNSDKIIWQWNYGDLNGVSPLSINGNFFARREMTTMVSLLTFSTPRSLENQLQIFKPWFQTRYGIGYKKSKVMSGNCHQDLKQTLRYKVG
jgi:glycosyltransferase involved in cell wall biosynthesis